MEPVIVCQSTWIRHAPNMDAYTWSEYEWLMMEVNTLWRRAKSDVNDVDKRVKILFFVDSATRTLLTRRTLDSIDRRIRVQSMIGQSMVS